MGAGSVTKNRHFSDYCTDALQLCLDKSLPLVVDTKSAIRIPLLSFQTDCLELIAHTKVEAFILSISAFIVDIH